MAFDIGKIWFMMMMMMMFLDAVISCLFYNKETTSENSIFFTFLTSVPKSGKRSTIAFPQRRTQNIISTTNPGFIPCRCMDIKKTVMGGKEGYCDNRIMTRIDVSRGLRICTRQLLRTKQETGFMQEAKSIPFFAHQCPFGTLCV